MNMARKKYRTVMVNAKKKAEQTRCDGDAIRHIQNELAITHDAATRLWFGKIEHTVKLQKNSNAVYREMVNSFDRFWGMIDKHDRTVIVYGTPYYIFDY